MHRIAGRSLAAIVLLLSSSSLAACSGAPSGDAPDFVVAEDDNTSTRPSGNVDSSRPVEPSGGGAVTGEAPLTGKPAPAGWCAGKANDFCADFDTGALPNGFDAADGPHVSVTRDGAESPRLLVNVPALEAGPAFSSKVVRAFPNAASDMTVAFDIFPERLNTKAGALLVAAVDFHGNQAAKYSIRLALVDGRARVEEGPGPLHPLFDLPPKAWSRVEMHIVLGTTTGTLELTLDGKRIGSILSLTVPPQIDRKPKLLVGAVYGATPTDGWNVGFDNVTMDVR